MAVGAQEHSIGIAAEQDLPDLLPLMRGYCDFYRVSPSDEALLAMARALIADPAREGLQLIARSAAGSPEGFATIFWSWSTLTAARLGTMNDLYVVEAARGAGLGRRLIERCLELCAEHGASTLEWETALENTRAQALYNGVGATPERWLSYHLDVPGRGMLAR